MSSSVSRFMNAVAASCCRVSNMGRDCRSPPAVGAPADTGFGSPGV
jgi:hypothetical protein